MKRSKAALLWFDYFDREETFGTIQLHLHYEENERHFDQNLMSVLVLSRQFGSFPLLILCAIIMDGATARPHTHPEINWDRLDKTKFYAIGAGLFTSVTVALYPISVVKTRLQVTARQSSNPTAISIFRHIIKADGISGLYRGFGTVVTGAVPGRIIFLTTLETTKVGAFRITEKLNLPEPTQAAIANGVAGMISSFAAQSVFVPLDVVSQRLMVQGIAGATKYSGGIDAARKIIKIDGICGLYRGFGMSVLTYSPSSAVWWASYGSSQRIIWRSLGYSSKDSMWMPSQGQIMLVQALGGFFAGAVASCVTTPLDTIKTRLQVMDTESRPSVKQTIKSLIDEDGWRGLYRGIGPRFVSMSAWGTSMILAYEYLSAKRICVLECRGGVCGCVVLLKGCV